MERIRLSIEIKRPIDEVRRHYFDIPYHAVRRLHRELSYTIKNIAPDRISYIQEVSILKLKHRDECVQCLQPNGDVTTEITTGLSRGFRACYHFEEKNPGLTQVIAEFTIPLPGVRKWIAPLFRRAVVHTARRALQEDKEDLESLAYRHHTSLV